MNVLPAANGLAALASAGSSVAGAFRPGLALPDGEPVTTGTQVYVQAYAARAVPLGLVTAAAMWTGDTAVAWSMLLVSGVAQVADSAIGFRLRNLGMGLGAGAFAVLHLASAWWVAR